MNTNEIERTVANDKCVSKYFIGVFPSDNLPEINKLPSCFIANTDPSNEPGQHWVALFFDKNVEYFDSYGLEPLSPFKHYKPDWLNRYCLQRLDTTVCGEYCIYFLHNRCCGIEPNKIVSKLLKRSDSDTFVKLFVNKLRVPGNNNGCQSCISRDRQ